MNEERISLYYKDERSDKEYHVQLLREGDLWTVDYQNGRRGGTLASGKKTPKPVAYEVAKKKYDSVVKEKLSGGYSPGEAGTAFVGTDKEERFTGILPQLLNPIKDSEAESYLRDPDYVLQDKSDGHRRMVKWSLGDAQGAKSPALGINRKGLATGLPKSAIEALQALSAQADTAFSEAVFDGELVGDVYVLFDVLEFEGKDLRAQPLVKRLELVEKLREVAIRERLVGVEVTRTAYSEADKRAYFAELQARKAEGGVFKRLDAPYTVGRPSSGGTQLKLKFYKEATLLVNALHATKRSIHLAALDADGVWKDVGKCTVPANQDIPKVGDLVEVRYLYAYPGGSLFQPTLKGVRDDVEKADCVMAQLHFKAGTTEEDEEEAVAA